MSTDNSASGATKPTPDTDDEQTIQTLKDIRPRFDCEITVIASVPVEKSMRAGEDSHITTDENYGEPDWYAVEIDTYRCTGCHTEFDTEADAKTHLRRKYNSWQSRYVLPGIPGQPTDTPGRMPVFEEETDISINDLTIRGRPDNTNSIAVVESGIDGLIETSRREYAIPENFNFDSWEPLNGGQLTYPNGGTRIAKCKLASAIKHLSRSNGPGYNADKFTLYDRGDEPFLLATYGEGIVIAPYISGSPTEE